VTASMRLARSSLESMTWIAQALADDKAKLREFATGLLPDKAEVEAGLALPRSAGPCEAPIDEVTFQNAPQTPTRR
jgi:hypothetical protein